MNLILNSKVTALKFFKTRKKQCYFTLNIKLIVIDLDREARQTIANSYDIKHTDRIFVICSLLKNTENYKKI